MNFTSGSVSRRRLVGAAMRMGAATALLALIVVGVEQSSMAVPRASGFPALSCDADELSRRGWVLPRDTTVTSAVMVESPVRYCRVDGYITTVGPGDHSNQVNFMVALPDEFNGRYLFVGVGGTVGRIVPPPVDRLAEGYVTATTDTGNQSDGLDWSFGIDRVKATDYAYRAVHVTAVATQRIAIAYYYGRRDHPPLYRYIVGCSGGARQGLVSAQAYPEDFDGVVVTGGGNPTTHNGNRLFFGELVQTLQNNPEGWISPDTLEELEAILTAEYDALDGAVDGIVADPLAIGYPDIASAPAVQELLTEAQLQTVRLIVDFYWPGDYPGRPAALPTTWASIMGSTPPPWDVAPALGKVFETHLQSLYGLDYDFWTQFDFDDERQIMDFFVQTEEVWGNPSDDPFVTQFEAAGGKLLFVQGAGDSSQSPADVIRYYNELAQLRGGYDEAQAFYRFYLAQGVGHCQGGPGPQDINDFGLAAIVDWVEHGVAPEELIGHNPTSGRSFVLCPYPATSTFAGGVDNPDGLDVNDAANWTCT